jgi:hypothetical protein
VSTPEFLLSDLGTIFNKMAILKFLTDAFGERGGWGGIVALESLLTLKKQIRTFNFQSNEPSEVYTSISSIRIIYAPRA